MSVEVTAIGEITIWIGRCQCRGCKQGLNEDYFVGGLWEDDLVIYRTHGHSLTEVFTNAIDRAVEYAIDEKVGGRLWQ